MLFSGGLLRISGYHTGQSEQSNGIGNDHKVVEHIGQLPYQIIGNKGSKEDKRKGDDRIDSGAEFRGFTAK